MIQTPQIARPQYHETFLFDSIDTKDHYPKPYSTSVM